MLWHCRDWGGGYGCVCILWQMHERKRCGILLQNVRHKLTLLYLKHKGIHRRDYGVRCHVTLKTYCFFLTVGWGKRRSTWHWQSCWGSCEQPEQWRHDQCRKSWVAHGVCHCGEHETQPSGADWSQTHWLQLSTLPPPGHLWKINVSCVRTQWVPSLCLRESHSPLCIFLNGDIGRGWYVQ